MPAIGGKDRLLTLGACCFGLFMVMLDNTVVNVALPSIQRELAAGLSGLALVLDAYILVFASLLLTAGSLGDRFGRRRVFRAGLVVFTASSALCGLAPALPALVAGRVLQAVGAAALLPSSLAILTATFPDPRERVQAIDLPGLLLGSLGLGAVTLGLIESNQRGWGSPLIVGLLAGFALLGFVFFNTLYFQAVQGWSPLEAGLRSLPNTLAAPPGSRPCPAPGPGWPRP